jgi:hypothetical protein
VRRARRVALALAPLALIAAFFFLYVGAYVVLPLVPAIALVLHFGGRRESDALEALVGAGFGSFVLLVAGFVLLVLVYDHVD